MFCAYFQCQMLFLERCFSTMNMVKTDWRNRLGEQEVEHLVCLKKAGPAIGSAEASCLVKTATDNFFKLKPRRGEALNKKK